jgi:beta-glucosidase
VRRVLGAKFALGLFEEPYVVPERTAAVFETPAQRELARRAACESIVLLRNDGVLPLSFPLRRIAVIGPGADDPRLLQGDYHYPAHQRVDDTTPGEEPPASHDAATIGTNFLPGKVGEWQPGPYYTRHVTPLAGIRALAGSDTEVVHARGCPVTGTDEHGLAAAAELARGADVAIVVVAGRSGMSRTCTVGEGRDATDLDLTGSQCELVQACAATGTPTVVVVLSGRVHTLGAVGDAASALLQAWPLGEEGGAALGEVLFGIANPSGRLPVSLPRSAGQVPRYLGHRAGGSSAMFYGEYVDEPTTPLFAFGHGLSYTTFDYGPLAVEASDTAAALVFELDVTNIGARSGDEVVQLYASDLVASVARPERQLVGFTRVGLDPGETKRVRFTLHPSRLGFFDESMRRVTEPGAFEFAVGASSVDLRASARVELTGARLEYPLTQLRPTEVAVSVAEAPVPMTR